jgi:biopolymer transport protein ExbB
VLETLSAGGPVMIPIAVCSVVAVAVFLERAWSLRRPRVAPRSLAVNILTLTEQARFEDAEATCRASDSAVARVLGVAIANRARSRASIKERIEEVGRREAAEMERGIPILGTIASIAPLLGTVGGMIVTFQAIQSSGLGNVGSLAGGISQALITTFAGLTVGIPAVVANRWLLARVDNLLLDLEEASLAVLDALESSAGEHSS